MSGTSHSGWRPIGSPLAGEVFAKVLLQQAVLFLKPVHLSASQVKDLTEVFRASLGCLRADYQLSGRTTNRRTGVPGTLITRDSCFMLFLLS